ncbi:MAG TPA: hypothetical protein VFR04_07715 [Solirubrobacterales bacterium]|nr:hypothetical protein [Solirubrobacterales bacterium]
MIAAARGRIRPTLTKLGKRPARWSRGLDRAANRGLERAHPYLLGGARRSRRWARATKAWAGPRVRPLAARFFRAVAAGERWTRRALALTVRGATRTSAVITPQRAIGAVIVAVGAGLVASQFVDYRGVEIGQPGYAGLPGATRPPTVDVKTAGDAHSYLLAPVGVLAALLGLFAICRPQGDKRQTERFAARDRRRLGLSVAGLGLIALAVVLLVDLPAGLDAGAQNSRFAGAEAVLEDGFYAELAAAAGLVLAGLLYYARPCRIRISSSGRAASARRRRPRRRASSRARVARSA